MRIKFTFFLFFLLSYSFAQILDPVNTFYSKIDEGAVGEEKMTFQFSKEYLYKRNDYNGIINKYGPLYLDETGYNSDGFYFEFFKPNIRGYPLEFSRGKQLKAYLFNYNSQGGDLLVISEIQIIKNNQKIKNFYTKLGYELIFSSDDEDEE